MEKGQHIIYIIFNINMIGHFNFSTLITRKENISPPKKQERKFA